MSLLSLQPSSAKRWLSCRASPALILANADRIPHTSSEHADEGTLAHDYAEKKLKGEPVPEVSAEMADYVQEYIDYVLERPGMRFIELKVPLSYQPERNGKIDCIVVGDGVIDVPDLKYGVGVSVEARENPQLAIYGVDGIRYLVDSGLIDEPAEDTLVRLAIVQPRARDKRVVRMWNVRWDELLAFYADIASTAKEIQADPENQPFAPSDSTCQFCPMNDPEHGLTCKARTASLLTSAPEAVKQVFQPVLNLPDVAALSVEDLGALVALKKPMEAFLEGCVARAYALAEGGTTVPGWKLVAGKSSRAWRDEEAAEKLLRQKASIDDVAPRKLVSPAQAEKLLKGQELSTRFDNLFKNLIVKSEGKPLLVPESDERPALTVSATNIFSVIPTEDKHENPTT